MFETIISIPNLLAGYRLASMRCRNSKDRARFVAYLTREIVAIHDQLRAGIYEWGPYEAKEVIDLKRRIIHKAPFRDRVIHQAIYAEIEPLFDPKMIHHTYACRLGRGTAAAASQVRRWARQRRYALKMDVKSYFFSVNHERAKAKIRPVIRDQKVIELLDNLIDSFHPGIPIGNLTSQLFANWYLNDLDHYIKRELKVSAYARYMDDLILLGDCKRQLWQHAENIRAFAAEREKLDFPGRKVQLYTTKEGIPFLGYRIFQDRAPRVLNSSVNRLKQRMGDMRQRGAKESEIAQSVIGWWGHACYAIHPKLERDLGISQYVEGLQRKRL